MFIIYFFFFYKHFLKTISVHTELLFSRHRCTFPNNFLELEMFSVAQSLNFIVPSVYFISVCVSCHVTLSGRAILCLLSVAKITFLAFLCRLVGKLCASKRTGADKLCPGAGGGIASDPSIDPIKHFTPTQSLENPTRFILCCFFSLILSYILDFSSIYTHIIHLDNHFCFLEILL